MTQTVAINLDDLKALEHHAKAELPDEACALLLGNRMLDGQSPEITMVRIGDNVSTGDPRTSFEIDPKVLFEAQREARNGGPEIIGIWHSHPVGEPAPSAVDQARSIERNWVWLITGFDHGEPVTKGYLSGANDPTEFERLDIDTGC